MPQGVSIPFWSNGRRKITEKGRKIEQKLLYKRSGAWYTVGRNGNLLQGMSIGTGTKVRQYLSRRDVDMTSGNVYGLLIRFAIPLLLGNL